MNTTIVGQIASGPAREVVTARRGALATAEAGEGPRLRRLSASKPAVSHGALIYNNAALTKPGAHAGANIDIYA